MPAQANRVAAVLDDLGLRRVAVAAHSSGGYVGTALAEQRSDLVGELTGTVVSLAEIWGRDAGRVEDRLRAAGSWDERFTIAAEILGRRLAARRVDPEVAHAWWRTLTSRGRLRVDGLADEVGWDRRRLWSRFRSQLGITPKRAAQLVRFDHAAHLLAAGHAPARVAGESGYADQPHLHREVDSFTGLTPTAVATAPWLAIDDVAWPASSPARNRDRRCHRRGR